MKPWFPSQHCKKEGNKRKQEKKKVSRAQESEGSVLQSCCLVREASALARSTAPGDGYGRCWKRGPAAVVSAPVLASFRLGSPVDQVPLGLTESQGVRRGYVGTPQPAKTQEQTKEVARRKAVFSGTVSQEERKGFVGGRHLPGGI